MGNYHQLKNKHKYYYVNKLSNRGKLIRLGDVPVNTEIFGTPECVFGEWVIKQLEDKTIVQHFTSWDLGYSEYKLIERDSNDMVYVEVKE